MYSIENTELGFIFEMEVLMELHVLRTPESQNHILTVGVCVCLPVYVCVGIRVCYQHYIKNYSTNSKMDVVYLYHI